jgi:hypothetical protein
MNTCKTDNCESTNLVYSGVDAFILGVDTETYCYECANRIHGDRDYDDIYEEELTLSTTSC